jgi:hypothetical protein
MRTFMCTVGTYGLRGWNTSETPSASNAAPASSGRAAVADGGSVCPATWLKLQPPRSISAPSSIRRVRPSPVSLPSAGRTQPSLANAPPSAASIAATMRDWRSSRYARTAARRRSGQRL